MTFWDGVIIGIFLAFGISAALVLLFVYITHEEEGL